MAKRKNKPGPNEQVRFEDKSGAGLPKKHGSAEERERAQRATGDAQNDVRSLGGIVEKTAAKRRAVDDLKGCF